MARELIVENVGPVTKAVVAFEDITVLVGPQASGKSVVLELLKLAVDAGAIVRTLKGYGFNWESGADFLDLYLGEGMGASWTPGRSRILWGGKPITVDSLRSGRKKESLFFIPAQRVVTIANGWPRAFMDYLSGDPYVVRAFSENLRRYSAALTPARGGTVFPQSGRLKKGIRDALSEAVFRGLELSLDQHGVQRRLVLKIKNKNDNARFPFMVWSAGQREFVPLLLGLYWPMVPTKTKRRPGLDWVVIEELEMGLHPRAVQAVMLLVFDLVHRGYRVVLSTHSPQVLDVFWALRRLKEHHGEPKDLLRCFQVRGSPAMRAMAESVLKSRWKVFYFDPHAREDEQTRDISNLDPGSENLEEAGWGGLTDFSGRVAEIVAEVANRRRRRRRNS